MKRSNLILGLEVDRDTVTIKVDKTAHPVFLDDFRYQYEGVELECVPEEILLIPFVLNIAPVVWLLGLHVNIPALDEDFYDSLLDIRRAFLQMYPNLSWGGNIYSEASQLSVPDDWSEDSIVTLFSGGVDSIATSFRHHQKRQVLVTAAGADIGLQDELGWARVKRNTQEYASRINGVSYLVTCNIQGFLNYQYLDDFCGPDCHWWVYAQHGIGLSSLMAIPSYLERAGICLIASTHDSTFYDKPWGSHPKIDNTVRWFGSEVSHDCYDLNRQKKIEMIYGLKKDLGTPTLRVCYINEGGENCCECEKCLRTIVALVLVGASDDLSGFGFPIDVESLRLTLVEKFNKVQFNFNDNTTYQWNELKSSANASGEKNDIVQWLKEFDFEEYRSVSEVKFSRYRSVKNIVSKVPGLIRFLRSIRRRIDV